MPVSLRKLSKNAFKRKIKQTLFEILASEDCYIASHVGEERLRDEPLRTFAWEANCYIDLSEIVQKVKLNLFSS